MTEGNAKRSRRTNQNSMVTTAVLMILYSFVIMVSGNTCPQTVSSKCGTPPRRGLSSTDRTIILRDHNVCRNNVARGSETRGNPGPQPAASNMLQLTWDDELARLAQSWADQCKFEHNMCGGSSRFSVGQNLYASISSSSATQANFTNFVYGWYNEVQFFNRASIYPFKFTSQTGHYSQLCWAETKFVGCGFIQYRDSSSNQYWSTLVCNYGPAGNVINGRMYNTSGRPCSSCSSRRCSTTYTSLCA